MRYENWNNILDGKMDIQENQLNTNILKNNIYSEDHCCTELLSISSSSAIDWSLRHSDIFNIA